MSSLVGITQTLERLHTLKAAVSDCTAREAKLEQAFRLKTATELEKHEAAVARVLEALAEQIRQAEAVRQTELEAARAKADRRKTQIGKALKASKKQALERIDVHEGRRKYELQKSTLETHRKRDTDLVNNDATLAEYQRQLAESHETYAALERQVGRVFSGYEKFLRLLAAAGGPEPDLSKDEYHLLEDYQARQAEAREGLGRFRRRLGPALFRFLPAWLLISLLLVGHGAAVPALRYFQVQAVSYGPVAVSLVLSLALLIVLYYQSRRRAEPAARRIAVALEHARRMHSACQEKCVTRHQQEIARLQQEFESTTRRLSEEWTQAVDEATGMRQSWPLHLDEKAARAMERNERLYQAKATRLEQDLAAAVARLTQAAEEHKQRLAAAYAEKAGELKAEYQAQWQTLEAEWQSRAKPGYEALRRAGAAADAQFPVWRAPLWESWTPPPRFDNAVKFGRLEVNLAKLAEALPQDPRLALPGPATFALPLLLTYPHQGSLLLETTKAGSDEAAGVLNNIMLRLLGKSPAGKLSFTIIDPVKLGENFAGIMHLSDYEESLINSRIWTQTTQIEQRLADLNEHMEKVIQMYLRNEYETIVEYNEQAGNIAEKFHFVVIADFPVNFSDTALKRLINIAASGARCGVYLLIHWDRRQAPPPAYVLEELRKRCLSFTCSGHQVALTDQYLAGTRLVLDAPPEPDFASTFLHTVGQLSKDSNRVEVPFAQVAPPEAELWSGDTTEELLVPIGRSGATKFQYLAIGKGTRQHALIAGKTGSGKSTLFHVIITNLALWFGPDQVEFYLVDFKKGVEFKCYATHRLPHARVVAIESDREFGLSVLQRVDAELKRRGDLFRQLGVQDIPGYKRAGGTEAMPRSLLIVDEFQEFFVEDDQISQNASVLLDRIVRQGRAFGIHVLLGSQTLGGAYTLARATMGQMVIRMALQCNEADAYLIMDENNPAPRLLSRPGEGIYNDAAGVLEGNSPFQTVWLPDEVREVHLDKVRGLADQGTVAYQGPIVFEGNAPADARENLPLRTLLEAPAVKPAAAARLWLGAPNSIKGPTEAVFHPRSGNNLLIAGQREEAALAILSVGLVSLAAQYPRGAARFVLLDSNPPDSPAREYLERIARAIPHDLALPRHSDAPDLLNQLAEDLKARTEDEHASGAPAIYLIIQGLQNFKKLRREEEFSFSTEAGAGPNAAAQLGTLISEGPSHGIHVIATCDTYNNVNRFLGRKALSEFEMRVLFQMSANDSASLIDNPKAGTLGLHRALFYNEQEGYLETFRPYALPPQPWVESAARQLARLAGDSDSARPAADAHGSA